MEKIVIIGSSGAGKSTLARALGSILRIKVYHLDRLFWQIDWKKETKETRIDILQGLIQEKQWIIEGTYLNSSEELHLQAADTIIFLDFPFFLCLQRIIRRHLKYYGSPRRDIPKGCTDKLTLRHMFKVLAFPLRDGRTLKQKLRKYETKQIFCLHSTEEVKDFLAQREQSVDGKSRVCWEKRKMDLSMKSYPGLIASMLQYFSSLQRALRSCASQIQPGLNHLAMVGVMVAGIVGKVSREFFIGEVIIRETFHHLKKLPVGVMKRCQDLG